MSKKQTNKTPKDKNNKTKTQKLNVLIKCLFSFYFVLLSFIRNLFETLFTYLDLVTFLIDYSTNLEITGRFDIIKSLVQIALKVGLQLL